MCIYMYVYICNYIYVYMCVCILSAFSSVPGDVLHGSAGHQDPLETDSFPLGMAHLCQRRSVSFTHSFYMWPPSSPCAVFPPTAAAALPALLC